MADNNAAEQASGKAKVKIEPGNPHAGNGGVLPPKHTQFGQPGANPRNNGSWKKTDTARYKLEQMLKLTAEELKEIAANKQKPFFERKLAEAISQGNWTVMRDMINQVYGMPGTQAPEGTIQKEQVMVE